MTDTNKTTAKPDAAKSARKRARKVTDRVADSAKSAQQMVTETATSAGRAASDALDTSPLGALAGAIAIGAVAAAFIPTTRRELEALGPWAEKLRDAAGKAFAAAKQAGTIELTAAGLSVAAASDGIGGVVGKIVKAATASASAAATSVKQSRTVPVQSAPAPSSPAHSSPSRSSQTSQTSLGTSSPVDIVSRDV